MIVILWLSWKFRFSRSEQLCVFCCCSPVRHHRQSSNGGWDVTLPMQTSRGMSGSRGGIGVPVPRMDSFLGYPGPPGSRRRQIRSRRGHQPHGGRWWCSPEPPRSQRGSTWLRPEKSSAIAVKKNSQESENSQSSSLPKPPERNTQPSIKV